MEINNKRLLYKKDPYIYGLRQFSVKFCARFAIFIFSVSLALGAVSAHAERVGLLVNQTIFDVDLIPGTSHKESVFVINQSNTLPLPLRMSLLLWNTKENSDELEFVNSSVELNATKWFRIEGGGSDILKPGEKKEIHFLIEAPKTASPGSYFVMIKFQAVLPDGYFTEGSARQIPEIGSLFFIKISNPNLEGRIDDYNAKFVSLVLTSRNQKVKTLSEQLIPRANAGFFESAIEKLDAKILNNGLYHFKTDGFVEIKNWYGRTVQTIPLPKKYLLPQKVRNIEVSTLSLDTEFTGFWQNIWHTMYTSIYSATYFGPYTATLHLQIPSQEPLVTEISFWVVPWKFWLPTLLILFGLGFYTVRFRKRLVAAFKVLFAKPTRNNTPN